MQFFTDLSQRPALTAHPAGATQLLGQLHDLTPKLCMRPPTFTLPQLLTLAVACVLELMDQTGFLVLGEGIGDLAQGPDRRQ